MEYKNHLKFGSVSVKHRNKNVVSSLNSSDFEKFLEEMDSYDFDVGTIPPGIVTGKQIGRAHV